MKAAAPGERLPGQAFLELLLHPRRALQEQADAAGRERGFGPALAWLGRLQAACAALLLVAGLGWWGLSTCLSESLGPRLAGLGPGAFLAGFLLSPLEALLWCARGWAALAAANLAAAWLLEAGAGALLGQGRRGAALAFNVLLRATAPWQVLAVLPWIGWLAAAAGALCSAWLGLGALYRGASAPRRALGLAGLLFVGGLSALLAQGALAWLLEPLQSLDPLGAWVQRQQLAALLGGLGSAR